MESQKEIKEKLELLKKQKVKFEQFVKVHIELLEKEIRALESKLKEQKREIER